MKWLKQGNGNYRSECGRFIINRFIRRYGIEWQLIDTLVPLETGVNGCKSKLRDAKDAAEWRLLNKFAGKPLIEIL